MAYVEINYSSKKAFRAAIAAGVEHRTFNPSGMFPVTQDGRDVIEGPHYPKPHRWYAAVEVRNGIVISAK